MSDPRAAARPVLVLAAAFLAWMFAGVHTQFFSLIGRPALRDLLGGDVPEPVVRSWLAWYQAAFLFGAAAGGWLFGWLGDRLGRARALGLSVLCFSLLTGLSYVAPGPTLLGALRLLACLGVGGTWPSAVALVAEAWSDASRPVIAGLLGTAANVGNVLFGVLAYYVVVTPESWRWALLLGTAPAVLGALILVIVPESSRWLAQRSAAQKEPGPLRELARPPLRARLVLGTVLGAVAVVGTAANANWATPWSDQVAEAKTSDPRAKAVTQITRSGGGVLGSLLGGVAATLLGRRLTYFLISLLTLAASTLLYGFLDPLHFAFQPALFALGFFGVLYFGWLPLYLPELFPTRARATGSGIAFNSGRIVAALVALGAAGLAGVPGVDYARLGLWTGAIYVVGMLAILFAPRTQGRPLED